MLINYTPPTITAKEEVVHSVAEDFCFLELLDDKLKYSVVYTDEIRMIFIKLSEAKAVFEKVQEWYFK